MEVFYQKPASWTVPKYRSTNVYTSSYIKHRTVQCEVRIMASISESGSTSRVAHSFGSGKLYIGLSNKCFKVYPVYSLCTDIRPSHHRILRMQTVRINLAIWTSDILYYACIMIFEFSLNRSFWHRCQNCIREKKFSKKCTPNRTWTLNPRIDCAAYFLSVMPYPCARFHCWKDLLICYSLHSDPEYLIRHLANRWGEGIGLIDWLIDFYFRLLCTTIKMFYSDCSAFLIILIILCILIYISGGMQRPDRTWGFWNLSTVVVKLTHQIQILFYKCRVKMIGKYVQFD